MKKIVQNIVLSIILLAALVPVGMGAMNEGGKLSLGASTLVLTKGPLVASYAGLYAEWWNNRKDYNREDINKRDEVGNSPLHYICQKGNLEEIDKLISKGAKINNKNYSGKNVVHDAAERGNLLVLKYLLEKHKDEIDINQPAGRQLTPLHYAANLFVIKLLVEAGSKLTCKAVDRKTPRDYAKEYHMPEAESYLELAEDFYAVNNKQMTFDAFAQKHLINTNKTIYATAKQLLEKIKATQQLNEQKLKEVKKNLEYVELNYETDYKLKAFAKCAEKYLADECVIRHTTLMDVYNLLHLGTRAFFDEFVGFIKKHGLLNFNGKDGNEKEAMLFDCVTRLGPKREFWFEECCRWLKKKPKNPYEPASKLGDACHEFFVKKLPIKEQNRMKKIESNVAQQEEGFLNIPKNLRIPKVEFKKKKTEEEILKEVGLVEFGTKSKKKQLDANFGFKSEELQF